MKTLLLALGLNLTTLVYSEMPAKPGERILFLGDSITQAGTYVALIDAAVIASHPELHFEIISAGLSSETVSGLSEPGHADGKFPRPDLHERLDRALAETKPHVVVACYGMNCGIYMPLSEERFTAYKDGIMRLREKVMKAGARMIHITPPVFDPEAIKGKTDLTGVAGAKFTDYDSVLAAYSDWLLQQKSKAGWEVLDLHSVMKSNLAAGRAVDEHYVISKDGVHPGVEGHAMMAQVVLDAWAVPASAQAVVKEGKYTELWVAVQAKQAVLRAAWLSQIGHKRPGVAVGLPLAEAQLKAGESDALARTFAQKIQ